MRTRSSLAVFALGLVAGCASDLAFTEATEPPETESEPDLDLALRGAQACRPGSDRDVLAGRWDPRFTVAGFTGADGPAPTAYEFARDVDGSILAAGAFRYLGRDRVEPLLRLRNGRWQPARMTWELDPPGAGFSALAIDRNGRLALATYDNFGPRAGQIWLDDGSGLRVIGEFDGLIRRLRWYRGELWAAGWDQIHQGDAVIQGLAVWNGATWSAPPGGAPAGFAFELVEDGRDLLVGGDFTAIGGVATNGVAAFDGVRWRAMSLPSPGAVYALARTRDRRLYAGGAFGDLGGGTGGLVRWTGSTWVEAAGGVANRAIPGVVTDLVEHAGSLHASGCFASAGGAEGEPGAVAAFDIARFDGAWHSLDDGTRAVATPWFEPRACGDEGPASVWDVSKQAMFSAGDQLLLGGSFPGIAGVQSQAAIGFDGRAWRPQGDRRGFGVAGSMDRLGVAGSTCELWGTGQFSHLSGAPTRARVARFTGGGWVAIRDPIPNDAFCPGFAVSSAGDVALGCIVFPAEGDAIGRVYRVRGAALVQVGPDQPPVQAVAYDARGTLWIAGGGATGFVARLDGDRFNAVPGEFDAPVSQLDVVAPRNVIAGGSFSTVGGVTAARIARWNGAAWAPLGAGLPGTPSAIAHGGGTIYASTFDEGSGAFLLGAFDGSTWRELAAPGSGLTPQSFFNFNAIQIAGDAVLAVGTAVLDDGVGRGALVYRDGAFTALGGGVHAILLSGLAVARDAIWVGGVIAEAGAPGKTVPTVGIARYVRARTAAN
jgi:hypothetical protein